MSFVRVLVFRVEIVFKVGMLMNNIELLVSVLQYYIHPVSGRKFRSKNEVLTFVETGTIPRFNKKKQSENTDANAEVRQI